MTMPTEFIVNRKTGDIVDRHKCMVAYANDGRVRVYPSRDGKNVTMDGADCVVVKVHSKVRATISHPTFRHLVKRLADSEGVPLSEALCQN